VTLRRRLLSGVLLPGLVLLVYATGVAGPLASVVALALGAFLLAPEAR